MVKLVSNPPNPWASTHVEWLEEPPTAELHVYEEPAKSILSENDSPDVGFRWSVNPYRGCFHACAYCLSGDTPILMANGRRKPLRDVRVGDEVYGTVMRGRYRRFQPTPVLDHWQTIKPAYRVTLADGTKLLASGDHRFLTQRGWKHVAAPETPGTQRPYLTTNDSLLGIGQLAAPPEHDADHRDGYLCGMIRGDGLLRPYSYSGQRRPGKAEVHQFRLGLVDFEGLTRTRSFLEAIEVTTHDLVFQAATAARKEKFNADLRVVSVEALGIMLPMFDITTGTGDFIADGVISHNCYARPSHQYLGFGAGTDFERKLVVKTNAPALLRAAFMKPSWRGELIAFSGDTDCYQPLEASYELTRRCLEICAEFRNPVSVITKSAVIRRDVDLLARLAREARIRVTLSIPFARDEVARSIEPGASSPARRFDTLRLLSDAGVPTGVAIAPIIPGLNDPDIPEILERAYQAGARRAFMLLVRLPGEVLPVFRERINAELPPERVRKIEHAIEELRGGSGRMNDSRFGARFRGQGERWRAIEALFELHRHRLGYEPGREEHMEDASAPTTFQRPTRQLGLF